jgi:hypothetical protein
MRRALCSLLRRAADAKTAAAVLVHDGRVVPSAPPAPAALLAAAPLGTYTVARTLHRTRVVDWPCAPRRCVVHALHA